MNKRFFNQQNLTRRLRLLSVLYAMLLLPLGAWAQTSYFGINTSSGSHWVTDETAADVLEDGSHKITYDVDHNILTLNGIDLAFTSDDPSVAFIAMVDTDHPSLTVHLVGNNKLTLGDKACVFNGTSITFTTDDTNPGSLTIYKDDWSGDLFLNNLTSTTITPTYSNGLSLINNGDSYIIGKSYGLTVAGVQVTNANASNVLGNDFKSVSYDPTSSTLTLKGAHLDSKVISIGEGVEELKVRLVGYNWLGTSTSVFEKAATTKLTFTTSTTFPGSLQLSSALSGDNIFYENGLSYNDGNKVIKKNLNNTTVVSFTGFVNYVNSDDGSNSYIYSSNVEFHASYATAPIANSVFVSPKGTNTYLSMWPASFSGISLINKIMVQFDWGTCTNTNVTVQVRGMEYDEQEMEYSFDGKTYSSVISLSDADDDGIVEIPLTGEITSDKFELYFSSGAGFSFYPLNYAFISSAAYDLWIGDTRVTTDNASNVLGDGKVSFTENVGADTGSTYTLTLKGTDIAGQVKVGLANLTVDVQGTNTITVPEGNVFRLMNDETPGTCYLTIKTSTADGKLTLTSTSSELIERGGVFDYVSVDKKFNITIDKSLALIQPNNSGRLTDGSYHTAYFAPAYGVAIENSAGGKTEIYEGNATDVFGDGKVSFDKSSHTLTLNNAGSFEAISTTLSTLDIDLVGSNSLYRESNGSIFESASGEAVTIKLKSTGATGSLTMEAPTSYGATLIGAYVTLTLVDPVSLLSGDETNNKGARVYGVEYNLSVDDVQVTSVNASNVLGDDETATVVFTPAHATEATPATLTLNGATIAESIVSGLENLRVVINGANSAAEVMANSDAGGDKNITFVGGTNGGTNAATLTISAGDGGSAVSGFASVSYDGAYAAADVPFGYGKPDSNSPKGYVKSHMMGDNSYLNSLTITTVPHYPIWLYTNVTTSTQVDNTNKNTLLGASGDVSFDGNHTLSLKNSVNSTARIVSGLSELTISVDGDCIIASPDSGSVVRSINSAAPLTIEKASEASSASLKLATVVSMTAVKAFASLDYTGLILLSEGATYSSGALNDSNNQPLNEAIFTTGLKKPTLQMNYETDTYSFQNPNGGGTLKYSRYFANNEGTDEENQVDNGNTFQIFKNGRQYNDPYTVYFEVWVEANGNSSDKLYACRLDVKDMAATYGGTVPAPEFLPKAIEGVTVSGYSLGTRTAVAATVTEGNITLTGAGRQELDAIFSLPDGVEYIKTSTTETPQASFYLDVKPEKPTLSKAAGTYAGTQTITVTNLTPNATAMYYTYEGEEPENPNAQAFPEGGVDISSSKTLAVYYVASYETETSTEYLYSETVRETYNILEDPELAYKQGETAVTTAEWILGKDENVLPTLYNPYDLAPVTYESNNTDVATVATDGTVTVVGIGTAVITATTAETDVYVAGEASYTLTVKRQLDVSFSTSNEWATYCGTENLAMPEGLKAYQVTAVDGSTVTIGEIGYIPANTAVLLKNVSNNNTWSNIAASAYTGATSTFASNILIGTASDVDVSTISGGTVYVLYNNMFKRATGGTIPANRGYLVVEPSAVNAGNAPQLSITIGDENTTAISNTDFTDNTDKANEWYSIDGVKLNGQPQKPGLYIKNGKKVFINKK
jgi:hypothetical protein